MVITLIGYRGTGKSSVGTQLAARMNYDLVDTDREIEKQAGKSIAEIFAEDGESRFRDLEREELLRQLALDKIVISAGGGAILDPISRQAMQGAGPVVWLQASVETIVERLRNDESTESSRPSLTGDDIFNEVATVLAQREADYAEPASIIINTDQRDFSSIVDEIISQLSTGGAKA
ncbi:shikimate kinase [Thalassoglobus polymorphus]|uniref:Shikimate kinase n=1 Tax=Thalassoglobus polymorphus TaxID=2527994 RepID=A0A517QTL5_9PLAN|nr:shikimate kinase [Thalassoglobus polymorphus]QDT34984.1 Shikimate kinase [Thalassoglobus polymorphus]